MRGILGCKLGTMAILPSRGHRNSYYDKLHAHSHLEYDLGIRM